MKRINTIIIAFFILTCSSGFIVSGQSITTFDKKYSYYYGDLSSKQKTYYKYYVPPNEIGVFTLKNKTGYSDFDLYIYDSSSYSNLLEQSAANGTETELIHVAPSEYGRYLYIYIANYGDYSATYNLYAHDVNPGEKLAEAALISLFKILLSDEDNTDEQNRNVSRGVNLANSLLRNYDLESTTRSLFLNELTSSLQQEMGYGALAEFAIDATVLIFDEILKHYW